MRRPAPLSCRPACLPSCVSVDHQHEAAGDPLEPFCSGRVRKAAKRPAPGPGMLRPLSRPVVRCRGMRSLVTGNRRIATSVASRRRPAKIGSGLPDIGRTRGCAGRRVKASHAREKSEPHSRALAYGHPHPGAQRALSVSAIRRPALRLVAGLRRCFVPVRVRRASVNIKSLGARPAARRPAEAIDLADSAVALAPHHLEPVERWIRAVHLDLCSPHRGVSAPGDASRRIGDGRCAHTGRRVRTLGPSSCVMDLRRSGRPPAPTARLSEQRRRFGHPLQAGRDARPPARAA